MTQYMITMTVAHVYEVRAIVEAPSEEQATEALLEQLPSSDDLNDTINALEDYDVDDDVTIFTASVSTLDRNIETKIEPTDDDGNEVTT